MILVAGVRTIILNRVNDDMRGIVLGHLLELLYSINVRVHNSGARTSIVLYRTVCGYRAYSSIYGRHRPLVS
jgi:hypothetical protein